MGVPDRWPNYSKVRFRSDQHRANGAPEGSVGYIVEVYDDAYEVEVTEPETGETLFLGAVPDADLDLISGHGPVSQRASPVDRGRLSSITPRLARSRRSHIRGDACGDSGRLAEPHRLRLAHLRPEALGPDVADESTSSVGDQQAVGTRSRHGADPRSNPRSTPPKARSSGSAAHQVSQKSSSRP
jgi:hypothetical protein